MPLAGRDVVVAEAARTPFGRSHPEKGWFRGTHPNDLLGAGYRDLLQRADIAPDVVEDLVVGCTAPFGEQSRNIARNAWLQEGYPPEVPAVVLDRRCGSAQTASEMASATGPRACCSPRSRLWTPTASRRAPGSWTRRPSASIR